MICIQKWKVQTNKGAIAKSGALSRVLHTAVRPRETRCNRDKEELIHAATSLQCEQGWQGTILQP